MTDEPRDPPETPPKPPSNVIPFGRRRVRRKSKETVVNVNVNTLADAARAEVLLTVGELARRARRGGVKGWLAGRVLRPVAEAFDYVFRGE
ncbi:MAG: hypothetical protein C4551_02315 [Bacillota bacterium]|nr:MAG: hypothetical protein C4551_02315 [Bacillota bacterium]